MKDNIKNEHFIFHKIILFLLLIGFVCIKISYANTVESDFNKLTLKTPNLDTTGDGNFDTKRIYHSDGRIKEIQYDRNGDGKADEVFQVFPDKTLRFIDRDLDGDYDFRDTNMKNKYEGNYYRVLEKRKNNKWVKFLVEELIDDNLNIKTTKYLDDGKKEVTINPNISH